MLHTLILYNYLKQKEHTNAGVIEGKFELTENQLHNSLGLFNNDSNCGTSNGYYDCNEVKVWL